ncbi:MAG: EpsD family peptidyl-prolyl cis-trans isomerase [Proteobacteria bacterium]|nr:EpsD family peptidyl-prolyl cis-trans isomerase [Pseudomonadota bacterium]
MPVDERPMTARAGKTGRAGPAILWATAVFCAAALSACGGKGEKASSQVAAKVNDEEITIHQVNSQLARSGIADGPAAKEASRKILDALIDQQLLLQQAQRKKLDRDPAVMQAIEDSKRQILSQAYLERMVYSRTPPTPAEIKDFYVAHPELFAKRKAYKFHVFLIAKDKFNDNLKAALDNAKTAGDVSSALKSRTVDFKDSEVQWLAEQVPMEMLTAIAKMKAGDIITLDQGAQTTLMLLEGAVDSPVDEAQAKPVIEKFVANSRNKELLDAKLKQLRAGEQITYVGQFAEAPPGAAVSTPAPVPAPAAKEPQNLQPQAPDHIKKGLEGLK